MYDGTIAVYGATLDVALDTNNNPTDAFGDYYNDIPSNLNVTPSVNFQTIMNAVLNDLGTTGLSVSPTSGERIIYKDASGVYHVAIVLSLFTLDNTQWMYIVDLHDASILRKFTAQSADFVSGWGAVYVDDATGSGNFLLCSEGYCVASLDWLAGGGVKECCTGGSNCWFGAQKALIGRFINILEPSVWSTCPTTGVPTESVPWNSANNYIYSPTEQPQFDEVNTYYNVTKAAEYYLNNYGFQLSGFSNAPQLQVAINDPSSCGCGCTGVNNDCGSFQSVCDFFGYTQDLYMNFPPSNPSCGDTMEQFSTAFHEYNHAVVYSINGLENDINTPYSEGMAQFYACFYPADLGYRYNQCVDHGDPNYLYPYDVNYISSQFGPAGNVHSMALVWDEPLERLRSWSMGMNSSPQIIYDDTFNAIPRIGKGEDIRQGLAAMLAAEDNKQTPYWGFEDNYYNILASFAWSGIRIPSYTVNGQQTNANSIVIAGKLTTAPFSGNPNNPNVPLKAVQPLLSINYQTSSSSEFPYEYAYFDTFVGNGADSVLLISPDPSLLANQNVWNAAAQTTQSIIYGCAFVCATQRDAATCMSQCLANQNLQSSLRGYVPGYPNVYYVYTQYGSTDDLSAATICSPDKVCGQTLQNNDHNKGIYNNLHRTISIRLNDVSGIAASSNPLSFGKLYYRLMTQDTSGNWISSATRGEQWMLIWSPNPTNGGCTIAYDKGNSWLIETIFLLLAVIIFLEVAKYAKRH